MLTLRRPDPSMPPLIGELARDTETERVVAVYFARRPLTSRNIELRVGEQFPLQAKGQIKALGRAFGVLDADRRAFHELNYVGVLIVPRHLYREVRAQNLSYQDALELVQRRGA
jgi:hypothetical protein